MSKHLELARKLKRLAENGVDGEKVNAENLLNTLLKKHGIKIEELEGEKIEKHFFNVDKDDFDLWHQIVKRVNYSIKIYGEFPKKIIKDYGFKGNHMIECCASDYVEIEAKYDFYKKLYQQEQEIFYSAFLEANDLLVDNPNKEARKDLTDEEIEKLLRIRSIANKITKGQFLKQLTH